MKIVIDIPDEQYEFIKRSDKNAFATVSSKECMLYAIKNGIPLPKGHGDLIDREVAREVIMYEMCGTGYQGRVMRVLDSDFYTPTVIEADKEDDND